MKTIHLFSLLMWGVLALWLLPTNGLPAENADSKLSSEVNKSAAKAESSLANTADQEANTMTQQAQNNKDQEMVFGKIADLQIEKNRSVLILDKPDVQSRPAGAPVAEKTMKMNLDKNTEISDGTKMLGLSDLKIGQHVRIMYEKKWFGKPVVQSIVIQR